MGLTDLCDFGEHGQCFGYQERIVVLGNDVKCCETGQLIPAGTPLAECQLGWSCEVDDGTTEDPSTWTTYYQCLRVWRFARRCRRKGGCLAFSGIWDCLENAEKSDADELLAFIEFSRIAAHPATRLVLSPYERASLESGQWAEFVPMPDGGRP